MLRDEISFKPNNVNDHRAAAIDLQAEKAARPAAPCASYCYHAAFALVVDCQSDSTPIALLGNDNQYRIKIIVQINIANWVRSININHALSPYLTFFNIAKIETGSPNIWVATMMSW